MQMIPGLSFPFVTKPTMLIVGIRVTGYILLGEKFSNSGSLPRSGVTQSQ
jgi:hypothetical protein